MNFDTYALDSYLNQAFAGSMVEPFFDPSISSCSPQAVSINDFSWLEGNEFYPNFGDEQFSLSPPREYADAGFSANFGALTSDLVAEASPRMSAQVAPPPDSLAASFYDVSSVVINSQGPTSADLDQYRMCF